MTGTASWIWRANDSESCRRRKESVGAWSPVNHIGLSQGREKSELLEVLHPTLLLERLIFRYCTWTSCWKGLPWGTAPEPAVGKAYLEVLHQNLLLALPWGTAPEPAVGNLPWGTAPEPAVSFTLRYCTRTCCQPYLEVHLLLAYLEVLHQNLLSALPWGTAPEPAVSLTLRYCTRTCCQPYLEVLHQNLLLALPWGTAPEPAVSFTLRYCTRTCC